MNYTTRTTKTGNRLSSRVTAILLALAALSCVSLLVMVHADALYIITGGEESAIVLDEHEAETAEGDVVTYTSQLVYADSRASGYELTLKKGLNVSIRYDGAVVSARSKGETISALLTRVHITPSPLDMVLVDVSGQEQTVELTVGSDLTYYDRYNESALYDTVRTYTPDLPQGAEQVVVPGANGIRTSVYEVTYSAGQLVSRQFVGEESNSAVTEQILVGTGVSSVSAGDRIASVSTNADGSGVLTFRSGGTMKFSAAKSMTATAYTAGYGGADYTTATGTAVCIGTVAVDKNVIPLGTRMYIVTNDGSVVYGMAVAADTGVRGNKVDLYYDTYQQCINFGRRSCTVYLLQ